VGVEEGQIDELFGGDPWRTEVKGVGGGGRWGDDELGEGPGCFDELGGGFVADGDAGRTWREAGEGGDFGGAGEEFFNWCAEAEEDFVAMGVDGGGGGLR